MSTFLSFNVLNESSLVIHVTAPTTHSSKHCLFYYQRRRDIEGACGQLAITTSQIKSKSCQGAATSSSWDIEDIGGSAVTTSKKKKVPTKGTPSPSTENTSRIVSQSTQISVSADESINCFVMSHVPVMLLLVGGAIASLGMIVSGLRMKYRLKLNNT